MKKGINVWAKELKHNEGFAKQYEGVKTVQDIINVAKKQGYNINERELKELDLDAVSGGGLLGGVDVKTKIDSVHQKVGDAQIEAYATDNATMTDSAKINLVND